MPTATQNAACLVVRRDMAAVRDTLQRIKDSDEFAPLNLFGRRSPTTMLDYIERRASERVSAQVPFQFSSVEFDGNHAIAAEQQAERLAFTRDVSLRGIGFTHEDPLDADYVLVTFQSPAGDPFTLLLDIRWSNLPRGFNYLSGGRFVGVVDAPKDQRTGA